MLRGTAEVLEELTVAQLRPLELALTEFLVACWSSKDGKAPFQSGAVSARDAHLHRICQTIETHLGDPELTARQIAAVHGVSLRYLQKLFTLAGKTFSGHVRIRRLERCRADLLSPLYTDLSITEICFRWGFNGSAHFSRTFREQYGMPPREYRRTQGKPPG